MSRGDWGGLGAPADVPGERRADLARRVGATLIVYIAFAVGLRLAGVLPSHPSTGRLWTLIALGVVVEVVVNVAYGIVRVWWLRRRAAR